MGKEAGRQIGDAKVTPLAPDFCKTPVGNSTPPLPYFPIGSFQDSDGVTKTVFFTGKKVFTTNSHITKVMGNEPGKLGGVKSGVNKGYCVPKAMHSRTFRVEGGWVIRHDSLFEMNCSSPKGGGNVMGKVVYIKVTAMAYVGENGEIKAFKYEAEDTQNNKEALLYQNGTDEELRAMDGQLPDEAFQSPLENNNLLGNDNIMGIEGLKRNPEFGTYEYSDNSLDGFNYDDEIVADYEVEEALKAKEAAQQEMAAAEAEVAHLEQEAQLDAAQVALGATGLIDPTPASDLVNAGISWSRGNYGEALLDGVSAFPYIGDLVAKPFKGGIVARRGVQLARKLEKARSALKAAKQKMADATRKLQDAAANLKKNKKNAKKTAKGESVDGTSPNSKKSKDQVKGKPKETKIPCFHPYDKKKFKSLSKADQRKYLDDYAKQLRGQQDAINGMTANEFKAARDAYKKYGRNPTAEALQNATGKQFKRDITASIFDSLKKKHGANAATKKMAKQRAKDIASKLAALHEPDMVSGGWNQPNPTKMGRSDINSSIGGSWNQGDRLSQLDKAADDAIKNGHGDAKMNTKLEVCRGKGKR